MTRPEIDEIKKLATELDPGFADAVSRWEIEVGEDHLGEPGIFVLIVLKDSDIHRVWESRTRYRKRLQARLHELYPEHFPFVTFSAESVSINPELPVRS